MIVKRENRKALILVFLNADNPEDGSRHHKVLLWSSHAIRYIKHTFKKALSGPTTCSMLISFLLPCLSKYKSFFDNFGEALRMGQRHEGLFWVCCNCEFYPHNWEIHRACIECGHRACRNCPTTTGVYKSDRLARVGVRHQNSTAGKVSSSDLLISFSTS